MTNQPERDGMTGLTESEIDELQVTLLRLAIKLGNDELEGKFARLCAQAKEALSLKADRDNWKLMYENDYARLHLPPAPK